MPREYTVPYSGTLTAAGGDADLFEFTPADDKPIELIGLKLGQHSEFGDAAAESIRISIIRLPATVTSGSGGSAPTPAKRNDSADAAAGFTVECNNTTVATTSGSAETLDEFGWNIQMSPCDFVFPEGAYKVKQGEALVVRCQSTVADDVSIAIQATVREH